MYSNGCPSSCDGHIFGFVRHELAYRDFHGLDNPLLCSLCRTFGNLWGLSSREIDDLDLLAKYHDLGKLIVPEHILFKKARLTEEEWEEIKLHALIGSRMARVLPGLEHIAPCIRTHHERWDGGGYPEGVCGEDIPFLSRILAVVDAYDAMIAKRPYKTGRTPHEQALSEIRACAGTQFDPRVAGFFVSDDFWSARQEEILHPTVEDGA